MDTLQIPPIRTPLTEANGQPAGKNTKEWYLFFAQARDSIAGLLTDVAGLLTDVAGLVRDAVKGAPDLLTPNAIPKIGPTPGALVESAATDDGSTMITAEERDLRVHTYAAANPAFRGRRANGTRSAPTAVTAGQQVAMLAGAGAYAANTFSSSQSTFEMAAAENWSSTARGTFAGLKLTPAGTTALSGFIFLFNAEGAATIVRAISGAAQPQLVLDSGITAKSRVTRILNGARTEITVNITYDGTNFNLDDTSLPGIIISLNAGAATIFQVRYYPAGANPRNAAQVIAFTVDTAGNANAFNSYQVNGTQVVGARGAALTASGGAVAAAPAAYNQAYEQTLATAINNLITRVNEIQARLQAHGLIT